MCIPDVEGGGRAALFQNSIGGKLRILPAVRFPNCSCRNVFPSVSARRAARVHNARPSILFHFANGCVPETVLGLGKKGAIEVVPEPKDCCGGC